MLIHLFQIIITYFSTLRGTKWEKLLWLILMSMIINLILCIY